jgi:tRNA(fMet)-specific endonuclease VapC
MCGFITKERRPHLLQYLNQRASAGHQIVISAITYLEMKYGAIGKKANPKHAEWIEKFVSRVDEILPFDREAVEQATLVKKYLSDKGMNIGPNDTLLAGHAIAVGAVMVTDNVREFSRVPRLRFENWREN